MAAAAPRSLCAVRSAAFNEPRSPRQGAHNQTIWGAPAQLHCTGLARRTSACRVSIEGSSRTSSVCRALTAREAGVARLRSNCSRNQNTAIASATLSRGKNGYHAYMSLDEIKNSATHGEPWWETNLPRIRRAQEVSGMNGTNARPTRITTLTFPDNGRHDLA